MSRPEEVIYRPIKKEDNPHIASIVREALNFYKADPKTTVLADASLDAMFEHYNEPRAWYFVAEASRKVLGGAGVKHLENGPPEICELQRMFLSPGARGLGIGTQLMKLCLEKAKEFGYKTIYLESFSKMAEARKLYERTGFRPILHSIGGTGHTGCNVFMVMDL